MIPARLLPMLFRGQAAMWLVGVVVPDQPGMEFTLPENRMHHTSPENRMHGTLPQNRFHFAQPEDD